MCCHHESSTHDQKTITSVAVYWKHRDLKAHVSHRPSLKLLLLVLANIRHSNTRQTQGIEQRKQANQPAWTPQQCIAKLPRMIRGSPSEGGRSWVAMVFKVQHQIIEVSIAFKLLHQYCFRKELLQRVVRLGLGRAFLVCVYTKQARCMMSSWMQTSSYVQVSCGCLGPTVSSFRSVPRCTLGFHEPTGEGVHASAILTRNL